MTTIVIVLNLAMALPAAAMLLATAVLVRAWPDNPGGEGRADWRGPSGPRRAGVGSGLLQRTAASIATATNSSAR
jgi:hypothetical protein